VDSLPDSQPVIVLTKGDLIINSMRYVLVMEKRRRGGMDAKYPSFSLDNVLIIDQEMLTFPWYITSLRRSPRYKGVVFPGNFYFPGKPGGFDMRTFLDRNLLGSKVPKGFRIFLATGWKEGDKSIADYYDAVSTRGVVQEVFPHAKFMKLIRSAESLQRYISQIRSTPPRPKDVGFWPHKAFDEHRWETVVIHDYWHSWKMKAAFFLSIASQYPELPPTKGTPPHNFTPDLKTNPRYVALIYAMEVYDFLGGPEGPHPPWVDFVRNLAISRQQYFFYNTTDPIRLNKTIATMEFYVELLQTADLKDQDTNAKTVAQDIPAFNHIIEQYRATLQQLQLGINPMEEALRTRSRHLD